MTWLTKWLSSRLSPAERDAVLGDAAERGTPGVRDLVSVLFWREARGWTTGSAWLALLSVVLPVGFVLSIMTRYWAGRVAVMLWIYVNNWTPGYLTNPGARLDLLADFVGPTSLQVICLVLWSWTAGRAVRVLGAGTVASNAVVLMGVLLVGTVGTTTVGLLTPANDVVFSSGFYRVGGPLIARIAFVLIPFWRGAVGGEGTTWWWTVGRTLATAILVGVSLKWIAGALFFGWVPLSISRNMRPGNIGVWFAAQFHGWPILLPLLAPVALVWPAAYLLIQARRQRLAT